MRRAARQDACALRARAAGDARRARDPAAPEEARAPRGEAIAAARSRIAAGAAPTRGFRSCLPPPGSAQDARTTAATLEQLELSRAHAQAQRCVGGARLRIGGAEEHTPGR